MFKVQFHTYGVFRLGSIPRIVQGFAKQLSGVVGKTVPGTPVMAGSQLRPPAPVPPGQNLSYGTLLGYLSGNARNCAPSRALPRLCRDRTTRPLLPYPWNSR